MALTHQDRCDSCGAQAVWSTWLDADLLLWCQHHFTKYEVKLRATATDIIQDPDMAAELLS